MSLKVKQLLDEFFFTENDPEVYTTGAFIVPMKIKKGGKEKFIWVVSEFNDDSYLNGELCSPMVYADSLEHLIVED